MKTKGRKTKKKHSMKPFIEMLANSTVADKAILQGAEEFRKSLKKFPSKPFVEIILYERTAEEMEKKNPGCFKG